MNPFPVIKERRHYTGRHLTNRIYSTYFMRLAINVVRYTEEHSVGDFERKIQNSLSYKYVILFTE